MKKIQLSTLGQLLKSNDIVGKSLSIPANMDNWVRIASLKSNIGHSFSILLSLSNVYSTTKPDPVTILIEGSYDNPYIKVTRLSATSSSEITKVRWIYESISKGYLEIYNKTKLNALYITADMIRNIEIITPVSGFVPEGSTVYEITL